MEKTPVFFAEKIDFSGRVLSNQMVSSLYTSIFGYKLISIILLAIGCTDNSAKLEKELLEQMGYESAEEYIENMVESITNPKPSAKEVTLLSLKYKIDKDKTEDLLVELNKSFGSNVTNEKIVEYSKKYSIPSETIASLLIDFYCMQNDKDSM